MMKIMIVSSSDGNIDFGISKKFFIEEKKSNPDKSLNEHTSDTFNKDETLLPFYTSTPKKFIRICEECRKHLFGIFIATWT